MLKKPLFLLIFLFFGIRAVAAVFVVTSNADSGPGTLRDAVTQAAANGNAEKDFIDFNLPDLSDTGRTITLLSSLPALSSNLEIDGSTQPGGNFGVSGAKVKIIQSFTQPLNYVVACFIIDTQTDVSIYGLLLDRAQQYLTNTLFYSEGIYIAGSKNITIGAPGKGNVIKNFNIIINTTNVTSAVKIVENLTIASNFLAVNEDGITGNTFNNEANGCQLWGVTNFVLGGNTPAEGNVIYGNITLIGGDNTDIGGNYDVGTMVMKNNFVGMNYLGTDTLLNNGKSSVSNLYSEGTSSAMHIEMTNNTVFGGLELNAASFFSVKGNKIGTDITGSKVFSSQSMSLLIAYCIGGGIVGGTSLSDQNIFSGLELPPPYFPIDQEGVIDNISSPNIEVIGNYFKCNSGIQSMLVAPYTATPIITNRSATSINGTAPPNSRVDLYYSVECSYCEPQILFTSVNTDASGNWSYSGALQNHAIIAAATLNGSTSEFTRLSFVNQASDVKITPACNGINGSITGLKTNSATTYVWYNQNGVVVSNSLNLINSSPGKYYLVISDTYCTTTSPVYEIGDATNEINDTQVQIQQPSCGNPNGSITGLQDMNGQTYNWTDQNGNSVGSTLNLINVSAGTYILSAVTSGVECNSTFGPIVLKNTTGPNIDQSHIKVQSTNCGQSNGSITNIPSTGTGTLTYAWTNNSQQTVSTDSILINQPAGTYILHVTDDTQCGPVYTSAISIPETNGITMDESKAIASSASCGKDNGSVTGIVITGATQYQWVNANNVTVGTSADLLNVPSGNYTLTASNGFGCSATSKTYFIAQSPGTIYPTYPVSMTASCYGQSNGSLTVTTDALAKTLRWVNSQNQPFGNTQQINGLAPDVYTLYLTDANGCESFYGSYSVFSADPLQIAPGSAQIKSDQCSTKTGSITNIQVTGGIPPYSYSWTLDQSNVVFSTSPSVSGLGSNNYQLTVSDSRGCTPASATYSVGNQFNGIPAPVANDVQLCTPGTALLQVQNVTSGYGYRLYNSDIAITPVDEQPNGIFKINVSANTSYYVSQFTGACESTRTKVNVSVGLSGVNIANTFTPNGDGINDYWQIAGIENYPNALVQIFNRYGQKLFESKGYSTPFDGTYKGQKLASGVYYYIINLNTNCNLLSGSLTILR